MLATENTQRNSVIEDSLHYQYKRMFMITNRVNKHIRTSGSPCSKATSGGKKVWVVRSALAVLGYIFIIIYSNRKRYHGWYGVWGSLDGRCKYFCRETLQVAYLHPISYTLVNVNNLLGHPVRMSLAHLPYVVQ